MGTMDDPLHSIFNDFCALRHEVRSPIDNEVTVVLYINFYVCDFLSSLFVIP